jgi:hypothetical protein
MELALNLDLRARAERLTYLVASQLLTKAATGDWLAVEQVVESAWSWLAADGGGMDWLQRISIWSWAQAIAERMNITFPVALSKASAAMLFSENPRLDFREPFVRAIYQQCLDHLVTTQSAH